MIFLFISIIFNAFIGIIFKHFGKQKVNTQIAIVINYWTCVLTGIAVSGIQPITIENYHSEWFAWSAIIGSLLITIFNVMSIASIHIGVTLTQAANKMSLAIPVLFSYLLYQDAMPLTKVIGILSAIAGVYLITQQKEKKQADTKNYIWLLPVMFIGSGAIDSITKYVQHNYIKSNHDLHTYLIFCFGFAATYGTLITIYKVFKQQLKLDKKSILAGIILGIPNYFSIYFLVKALQITTLDSSSIIPINNIGVLVAVSVYGYFIFNEKLNSKNKVGLTLALLSILLLLVSY